MNNILLALLTTLASSKNTAVYALAHAKAAAMVARMAAHASLWSWATGYSPLPMGQAVLDAEQLGLPTAILTANKDEAMAQLALHTGLMRIGGEVFDSYATAEEGGDGSWCVYVYPSVDGQLYRLTCLLQGLPRAQVSP